MKVAILGFAREGQAAYEYWQRDGNALTICDQDPNKEVPKDVQAHLGPDYLKHLDEFDLIVRTAGLHPEKIAAANPETPDILDKVTTSVNEFIQASPSRNIIGVTGTKGKGTTCTLIFKMLEATGHRVHLGGNIGIAPLELLRGGIRPDDWVILELSSFQLEDLRHSPPIAVCLTIMEEHLDWHASMDEYIAAKQQLFRHQKEGDIAIYYGPNHLSRTIAEASPGLLIPYMQRPGALVTAGKVMIDGQAICRTDEIRLIGRHNWQNVCAALTAVWNITQDVPALHKAISSFMGLSHRLELVREVDGVQYYNDSFSSAPGATIAALKAITGPKVLIVGGLDKGLNLTELAREIFAHRSEIQRLIIIGQVGHKIEKALHTHGFNNYDVLKNVGMSEIVAHARAVASSGDKVILSPGSSSFDMFKDFEDRGQQFKKYVNAL